MKTFLKLIVLSALIISITPTTVKAQYTEDIAEDLLATPQENEIVLKTEDDTIFDEKIPNSKTNKEKKEKENSNKNNPQNTEYDDDDSIMDNTEVDFEIFRMFDKDNDNKVDEDTLPGKIIHSKITRTDVQSFLLKDDLSFEYKKGPDRKSVV